MSTRKCLTENITFYESHNCQRPFDIMYKCPEVNFLELHINMHLLSFDNTQSCFDETGQLSPVSYSLKHTRLFLYKSMLNQHDLRKKFKIWKPPNKKDVQKEMNMLQSLGAMVASTLHGKMYFCHQIATLCLESFHQIKGFCTSKNRSLFNF